MGNKWGLQEEHLPWQTSVVVVRGALSELAWLGPRHHEARLRGLPAWRDRRGVLLPLSGQVPRRQWRAGAGLSRGLLG